MEIQKAAGLLSINLLGPFEILDPDGNNCTPRGRKTCAILAMLAVSQNGKHGRRWLQDQLWSDRGGPHGASSLRQALSEIRRCLGKHKNLLFSNHQVVSIDSQRVIIDIHNLPISTKPTKSPVPGLPGLPEFLEGLEIHDPNFQAWLGEQRDYWSSVSIIQPSHSDLKPPSQEPDLVAVRSIPISHSALSNVVPLHGTEIDHGAPLTSFASTGQSSPGSTDQAPNSAPQKSDINRQTGIAVLPFDNRTGEDGTRYQCEGFTGDLIDRLSRLRWLDVISHASTTALSEEISDPCEVGRRLGVGYVLEGELRRADEGLVANMRLINSNNGFNVWSGKYQISENNTLASIDGIAMELVGLLDARIDVAEQSKAQMLARGDMNFISLIWRARWYLNRLTKGDMQKSFDLLQQAIALQPNSPEALIQMTWWQLTHVWTKRGNKTQITALRNMAQKAIIADGTDGRGYALAGTAEIWLCRPDQARMLLTQAVSLNPSLAYAYSQLGSCNNLSDRPENAIQPLHTALRLSPHDQLMFYPLGELAMTHWLMGEHEQSVDYAERALALRQNYWYAHVLKINALHALERENDARAAVAEFQATRPKFDLSHIRWIPFVDPEWNRQLTKGLVSSGFGKPGTKINRDRLGS